jgi:Domain of unknown function (DUF4124)
MKTWLVLLGCLLAFTSSAQSSRREVWQWKDANGVTHFSDYPAPGARKIVLNGSPSSTPAASPASAAVATRSPAQPAVTEVVYDRLEIWSPESGANFFGADAVVNIRIRSEPELGPTDRLLTYLDGKLLPGDNALEHTLTNVERGAHSVTSVISSRDGRELIRSEPVVFHVRQPSINNTNPRSQGPTVRPPQPRSGG